MNKLFKHIKKWGALGLTVVSLGAVTVQWDANPPGEGVIAYHVTTIGNNTTNIFTTGGTKLVLTNLVAGVQYEIFVRAENAVGFSLPSDSVYFTRAAGLPNSPLLISSSAIKLSANQATITLNWEARPNQEVVSTYFVKIEQPGKTNLFATTNLSLTNIVDRQPPVVISLLSSNYFGASSNKTTIIYDKPQSPTNQSLNTQ